MGKANTSSWWRFSIRELLATVAIAALAIGLWQTNRRLGETSKALESLRDEVGYLTVQDDQLVHVINVPFEEQHAWRWRLHLPPNSRYRVKTAHGKVRRAGVPEKFTANMNVFPAQEQSGESLFTAKLAKNAEQEWELALLWDRDDMHVPLGTVPAPWLDGPGTAESNVCGLRNTETFEAGEPVVLLRVRVNAKGAALNQPTKPGFLVWLEPAPAP